jgi:hypothetical protein
MSVQGGHNVLPRRHGRFGGSIWHCAEPSTITKPGQGNPAWKLAAKHGRDGKDGRSAYQVAVDAGFS